MPGNCLWHIRILQPMGIRHIRRIRRHNIKRSSPEYPGCLFDIAIDNIYLLLKPIAGYTSGRHIRTFFLYLKSRKMLTIRLRCHQNRDNACTRSEIQYPFTAFCPCKARKQNRIHAKAKLCRILNNTVAISLKFIKSFTG